MEAEAPRIEIGRKYRLEIRPNPEYACPDCGYIFGTSLVDNGKEVTVLRAGSPFTQCQNCSKVNESGNEGTYAVDIIIEGKNAVYPYTWLIPLEEPA